MEHRNKSSKEPGVFLEKIMILPELSAMAGVGDDRIENSQMSRLLQQRSPKSLSLSPNMHGSEGGGHSGVNRLNVMELMNEVWQPH
jgi:hypothetical protein